jgi:hypothetical protein
MLVRASIVESSRKAAEEGGICASNRSSGGQARATVNFRKRNSLQSPKIGERLFASLPVSIAFTSVVHLRFPLTGTRKTVSNLVAHPDYLVAALLAPRVKTTLVAPLLTRNLLRAVRKLARIGKCEAIGEVSPGIAEIAAISRQFSPERTRRYS